MPRTVRPIATPCYININQGQQDVPLDGRKGVEMNIDPRFERAVKNHTPRQAKWTSIKESDLKALRDKVDIYEKAIKKITRHAYKGIVMQAAHKALSDAKELK